MREKERICQLGGLVSEPEEGMKTQERTVAEGSGSHLNSEFIKPSERGAEEQVIVKESIKAVSYRFFSRLRIVECVMIKEFSLSIHQGYRGRF